MVDNGDLVLSCLLSVDSIKMTGEAVGITNLKDDAAVKVSEDVHYMMMEVIQEASKFMRHSKRKKLVCSDLDMALKLKNVEPLYGFDTAEYIPFRHTSGGGKDLYYPDEQDVSLLDLTALPRLPSNVTIRAHWLAVAGVQPTIPENPPPVTIRDQFNEATGSNLPLANSTDPSSHIKRISFDRKEKKKEKEDMSMEWSKLKHLQAHALSTEQQVYYREITNACIGSEARWQEAINCLSSDPGTYQLLPQFMNFVCEGVRVNIAQGKLMVLKHLVKMVGALLDNPSLSLVNHLHDLIPPLLSAAVSRQLCLRPESEDHWSLRDNIGKILGKICKKYNNSKNNIQPRMQKVLLKAIKSGNDQGFLATHYGVMACLVEMGEDTIASLVVPHLKQEAMLIRLAQAQPGKSCAANKLQTLLLRHCGPVHNQ